jgi:hypothetical protein
MIEDGVHGFLVLEERKNADRSHVNLDHGKLARIIRAVSNDGDRFARQVAMKLGGVKVLETKGARNDSTQGCDSLSLNTSD